MSGGEAGVIVDTAARNLVSLNHIDGPADGILVAGDAQHGQGERRRRRPRRLRRLLRLRDRRAVGHRERVKANVVTRSAADGIHAVAGTWIGFNVALRNGALGINAPGATDGGGNRSERCAGVRCR